MNTNSVKWTHPQILSVQKPPSLEAAEMPWGSEQKGVQALALFFLSAAIQNWTLKGFELWGLSPDQTPSVPAVVAVSELSLALFICDEPPFQLHLNSACWFFPVAGRHHWWLRLLLYWILCSNKRQAPKYSLGGTMCKCNRSSLFLLGRPSALESS